MDAIKTIMNSVIAELSSPEKEIRKRLIQAWPKIAGEKIASSTKPFLGKNKTLWVWVEHSALAFELNQRYRQALLKRVQAVVGEQEVQTINIRVGRGK